MALEVQSGTSRSVRPRPKWHSRFIMFFFRTVAFTVLYAALGMGVGLLAGILVTIVAAGIHHAHPDMANAYRHVAVPLALVSGAGAFAWNVIRGIQDALKGR